MAAILLWTPNRSNDEQSHLHAYPVGSAKARQVGTRTSDQFLLTVQQCDGNTPSCSTCIAVYRTDCRYDDSNEPRRKGAIKRDIHSLQQQNDALDVIVASLKSLPEEEAIALLQTLRGDAQPETLAASLQADVRLPHSFAPMTLEADLPQPTPSGGTPECTSSTIVHSQEHSDVDCSHEARSMDHPTTWFGVQKDPEFVEHLLSLYFTWIHPFYHLISRDHFLHDMGRNRIDFSSPILVSAILAFACHYSDRPDARSDPHDPATAGEAYFAEAKRLLDQSDESSLTTTQALAIMSCRECSQGRESTAYQYAGRSVRMALELGLHLSSAGSGLRSQDVEVRKITFWGVFNVET